MFNMNKNNLFIILLILIPSLFFGQKHKDFMPDKGKPKKIKGYELVWHDEFNYSGKPDSLKWNYETGFVRNEELQWYQSENAICKNGVLLIEGKREAKLNTDYDSLSKNWRHNRKYAHYTSASINTNKKASWKFGRFEIRARIDSTKGSWPAIWTLGVDKPWPANGEIDLLEFYIKNNKQSILANAACLNDINGPLWDSTVIPLKYFLNQDPKWVDKFHVWRMDWDEEAIKLYLDDYLVNIIALKDTKNPDGFNPFLQNHFLLLNLAIGSNGGDPTNSKFPIQYEVDYVRVYQKKK